MEKIAEFLKTHPFVYGIFLVLLGSFFLAGSVFNWHWIFGSISPVNFDTGKIDGLVNIFGRKTARIVFGVFSSILILSGIFVIWLSLKK